MSHGTSQPVITPAAIFRCHLDDQVFELLVDMGTSRRLAPGRTIEFVSSELAVPTEDGLGLDDMRDFFPSFLPELFANRGQSQMLDVTELDASLDLVT
jgi:hypothetical protein